MALNDRIDQHNKMAAVVFHWDNERKKWVKLRFFAHLSLLLSLLFVFFYLLQIALLCNGPLDRYVKFQVAHAPGMPGTFPRHRRLVIPTCIMARASRTCRDACRDRLLVVSFEVDGGESVPGIPGATGNLTCLVRGPCTTGSAAAAAKCICE